MTGVLDRRSVTGRIAFDDYAAVRWSRLVRTAYLLTRDQALAEDLVQTALAKTWLAWGRIGGDPDPYVRRVIVNTYTSWWRRKWTGETPTAELPDAAAADQHAAYDER